MLVWFTMAGRRVLAGDGDRQDGRDDQRGGEPEDLPSAITLCRFVVWSERRNGYRSCHGRGSLSASPRISPFAWRRRSPLRLRRDEQGHGLGQGQMGECLRELPRCWPVVVSISSA
jgi:hypothetical protein